jgi:hypothetical protein
MTSTQKKIDLLFFLLTSCIYYAKRNKQDYIISFLTKLHKVVILAYYYYLINKFLSKIQVYFSG